MCFCRVEDTILKHFSQEISVKPRSQNSPNGRRGLEALPGRLQKASDGGSGWGTPKSKRFSGMSTISFLFLVGVVFSYTFFFWIPLFEPRQRRGPSRRIARASRGVLRERLGAGDGGGRWVKTPRFFHGFVVF